MSGCADCVCEPVIAIPNYTPGAPVPGGSTYVGKGAPMPEKRGCSGCTCDPALCSGGGVNPPETMEQALDEIWQEARRIMIQRHRDYGAGNIEKTGELGVAVRITDKLERLRNLYGLTDGRPKEAVGESVDDNWLDSLNYTMIALLLRRGWWGLPLAS